MRTMVIYAAALFAGVGAGCFSGEGLMGQPCRVDDDCNAVPAAVGKAVACVDGYCGVVCGDGVVAGPEACDDGNDAVTDACIACEVAYCGDGFTQAGVEACDDADDDDEDGCIRCEVAVCGDRSVWRGVEECDDGNADDTDACHACETIRCGDGRLNPGTEACDDANSVDGDGCNTRCEATAERLSEVSGSHVCAIRQGMLRCWGVNEVGQLGYGNTTDVGNERSDLPPADVDVGGQVLQVHTGGFASTCVVLDAARDNVRCWGFAGGALGNCDELSSCWDLHLGGQAGDLPAPDIRIGGQATQVSVGGEHTCVLRDDGGILCWGANQFGELGYPDLGANFYYDHPEALGRIPLADAIQVVAGGVYTCALMAADRSVRCWGNNISGALGQADPELQIADPSQAPTIALAGPAARIVAGGGVTCALLVGGALACWGDNAAGQLGIGSFDAVVGPRTVALGGEAVVEVAVGGSHVCARLVGTEVRCWGSNGSGELGHPTAESWVADPMALDPVDLGPADVVQLSAGDGFTCALLADGVVRCWGVNSGGQLAIGTIDPVGGQPGDMPPAPAILYDHPGLSD